MTFMFSQFDFTFLHEEKHTRGEIIRPRDYDPPLKTLWYATAQKIIRKDRVELS